MIHNLFMNSKALLGVIHQYILACESLTRNIILVFLNQLNRLWHHRRGLIQTHTLT